MSINAGVIGCGNISKFHFSGLEKFGAKVSWVCDLNQSAAQPWANKFNARYTANYRDIIADSSVNLIVIAASSAIHKRICLEAIDAGKAVVCEKTLAENAGDALEIVTAAQKKNTIFYTSYMKRFIPAVQKAKELIPSIGRIYSTYIRSYQCWGNLWDGMPSEGFFHKPSNGSSPLVKSYGGGILLCGGSHILDLVVHLFGRPTKLYAYMFGHEDADYDIQAAAIMHTAEGIVHYETVAHPLNKAGFLRDGWDERIEINGVNGRIEIYSAMWDQCEHKASMLVHYDNITQQSIEYRFDPVSPFDGAVKFFCENIENGYQGSQSRLTGYEVDELIEHIKKSSAAGKAVDIKWQI